MTSTPWRSAVRIDAAIDQCVLALHRGVHEDDLEPGGGRGELLEEVGARRRPRAGDHTDAHGAAREGHPLVGVEQVLFGQGTKEAVTLGGEQAEGVGGIDAGHPKLEATLRWVEVDDGADAHMDAVGDPHGPAGPGELAVHEFPGAVEQHDRQQSGVRLARGWCRFDQVEVDMARPRAAEVADLALDPEVVGHPGLDDLTKPGRELCDREGARLGGLDVVEQGHGRTPRSSGC